MSSDLPIVAIAGTLCDQRVWEPVLGGRAARSAIVVAGQVDGLTVSGRDMVTYVETLLDSLPDRFILAGFSLGGLIALEMIAQRPERVAGLALIAAGVGGETEQGAAARRADQLLAAEKGMAAHAHADLWPRFNARNSVALSTYVAMAEAVGAELYSVQNDLAISRQDSTQRIVEIDVPVLLISGDEDALCPPARLAAASACMANARHVTIPQAGHMIAFDQPEQLAKILDQWFVKAEAIAQSGLRGQEGRQLST